MGERADGHVAAPAGGRLRARLVVLGARPAGGSAAGHGPDAARAGLDDLGDGVDVVALLAPDATPEPGWLDELLARFADPTVGAVGGRVLRGEAGEERRGVAEVGLLLPNGRLTANFAADPGRDVDVDHVSGAGMAVRVAALQAIGAAGDGRLGPAALGLRLRRAGWRVVFAPAAVVRRPPRPDAATPPALRASVADNLAELVSGLGPAAPEVRRYLAVVAGGVRRDLRWALLTALGRGPETARAARGEAVRRALTRARGQAEGVVAGLAAVRPRATRRAR